MSNMGYCRFRNTASDLHDCDENLFDEVGSEEEHHARIRLISLCMRIANQFTDEEPIEEQLPKWIGDAS